MSTITLTIKTTGESHFDLQCDPSILVSALKELIAQRCKIAANNQRLIYKGRILKDDSTLTSLGMETGHAVHVVRSSPVSGTTASSGAAPAVASPPAAPVPENPMGNLGDLSGLAGLGGTNAGSNPFAALAGLGGANAGANPFAALAGLGGANAGANPFAAFGGMGGANAGAPMNGLEGLMGGEVGPNQLGDQLGALANNPEMLNLMSSVMSTPGVMRQMAESNPLLRNMMQSNPQIAQMLENPEFTRAMLNPAALQMASQSLRGASAGGANPLAGLAALGGANPFAGLGGANTGAAAGANPFAGLGNFDPSILQGLLSGGGTGGARPSPAEAETRYANQLSQLSNMGFIDRDANVAALIDSHGDVNGAITFLLNSGLGN